MTGALILNANPTTGLGAATKQYVDAAAPSGTLSGGPFTAGSVRFSGGSNTVSQDNANLFWDSTNKRLGLGNNSPATILDLAIGSITLRQTAGNYTITWSNPAAARALTLPDPGGADTFAFLAATQAFTNKTYNSLTITTTTGTFTLTNAKTLAVQNSLTLAGTDGTTLTFQGTDTYVGRTTTDTLTNKTLTSAALNTQLTLNQTTANYMVLWNNPAAARTLTIPDPGASDTFVFLAATQTLTNKTLTAPAISNPTITGGGSWAGGPTFGGGLTITAGQNLIANQIGPSAGQQHSIPAVASDTFALLAATQTLTNKTLSSPTLSGTVAGTPTWASAQTFPGLTDSGTLALSGTRTDAAAITVGVSPFTYTNSDGFAETVYIFSGTVSNISIVRNSITTQIGVATGLSVLLSNGDGVQVTYSVAPTMVKVPL
jgi:hypothetical protein